MGITQMVMVLLLKNYNNNKDGSNVTTKYKIR